MRHFFWGSQAKQQHLVKFISDSLIITKEIFAQDSL